MVKNLHIPGLPGQVLTSYPTDDEIGDSGLMAVEEE